MISLGYYQLCTLGGKDKYNGVKYLGWQDVDEYDEEYSGPKMPP